jgi:hypothetical protein
MMEARVVHEYPWKKTKKNIPGSFFPVSNTSRRIFVRILLVQEHDSRIQGRGDADPGDIGDEQQGSRF